MISYSKNIILNNNNILVNIIRTSKEYINNKIKLINYYYLKQIIYYLIQIIIYLSIQIIILTLIIIIKLFIITLLILIIKIQQQIN
jgi:hypothetical protein